ncbi:MAG: dihydroorotase [Candidatus Helarchaeota archaeon]
MSVDIKISGKILFPYEIRRGTIFIKEGKIFKISRDDKKYPAEKTLNFNREIIFPGLVDVHVHLRDFNLSYKEDFNSGTLASAAGGYTTIFDMPNTNPYTNSVKLLRQKMEKARKEIFVNVGFYSGIPNDYNEIQAIQELKPVGFKLFPELSSQPLNFNEENEILNLLECFRKSKSILAFHPEKAGLQNRLSNLIKTGVSPEEAFLEAHDARSESSMIKTFLELIKNKFIRVHVCHVTCKESLEILSTEKKDNVTCEVTPHHLFLNKKEVFKQGSIAKMLPPLRGKNRIEFESLFKSNLIDMIASDHAPHSFDEKSKNFLEAPSGIVGLETSLKILLTETKKRNISLIKLAKLVAENPAKRFNVKRKGMIKEGNDADLVIIDRKKKGKIKGEEFYSKAKFTPFENYAYEGAPIMTIIQGEIIMKENQVQTSKHLGKIIYSN